LAVHGLHLLPQAWGEGLVLGALEALRLPLGVDFLVIPSGAPRNRAERVRFLGALEALLEALQGRGVKIALRPEAGAAPELASILKEVRCEAVGYCWDEALGEDLEIISDRLFCAVGRAGANYSGLQRLGYRWNLAVPALDPEATTALLARLEAAHPMVYFPEVTA